MAELNYGDKPLMEEKIFYERMKYWAEKRAEKELGDKNTAVLWYKPEGKDKYVVMFGDLHVERMLKKDLPQDSNKKAN